MRPSIPNLLQRIKANGTFGKSLTPGQKIVAVNQNFGNPSIRNAQSTSRVMYDTLALDASTLLPFFAACASRTFPLTNMPQNKLQVQESFTVERIYFCALVTSATDTSNIIEALSVLNTHLYFGEWSLFFDTIQVIKPYPLSSQLPAFNHYGKHATNESNRLDTNQVIPPEILFQVNLRLPTYTAIANSNCRCVLEGFGTLFSPKGQF